MKNKPSPSLPCRREVIRVNCRSSVTISASETDSERKQKASNAQKPDNQDTPIILFIGNPGVGKSALLNSLAGEVLFRSGITVATGLTQRLQMETVKGQTYADTPGLDDTESKEQTAIEIENSLKQGSVYKICFVMTLESGRLKAADLATMQTVLDSIEHENINFGVIINKCSPNLMKRLQKREVIEAYMSQFGKTKYYTEFVFTQPLLLDIFDEENGMATYEDVQGLKAFLQLLPLNRLDDDMIRPLIIEDITAVKEKYEEELKRLRKDAEYARKALQDALREKRKFEERLSDLEKKNLDLSKRLNGSCTIL